MRSFTSAPRRKRAAQLGAAALIAASLPAAAAAAAAGIAAHHVKLQVLARVHAMPGNIAVTRNGTVIVSEQPASHPKQVAFQIANGKVSPFPNAKQAMINPRPDGAAPFHPVLGIRAEANGLVWMLSGGRHQRIKYLYAWDINKHRLAKEFTFSGPVVRKDSFFNDLALAPRKHTLFINDPAGGDDAAIIVVDTDTGNARRVLEGDRSLRAEKNVSIVIKGRVLGTKGKNGKIRPLRGAINPITIDPLSNWLYYGAMTGRSLYRIRVDDLLDKNLSPKQLSQRVQRYGDKPPSAGLTIDNAGNVYVADVQAFGIGVTRPDGTYQLLVSNKKLLDWPDGLSVGPQGYVYVASSGLYHDMPSHADLPKPSTYAITRFKALAATTVGR